MLNSTPDTGKILQTGTYLPIFEFEFSKTQRNSYSFYIPIAKVYWTFCKIFVYFIEKIRSLLTYSLVLFCVRTRNLYTLKQNKNRTLVQ